MELNLPANLNVKLELTAEQLRQLISEAALKSVPGYSKAEVTFNTDTLYNRDDIALGQRLRSATVSLSNPT
jgi:hypothetical protein